MTRRTGTKSTNATGGAKRTSTSTKTSKTSEKPSKGLKKHWQAPTDVKALAAQANKVATMVLNDEIDLEQARTYGMLVRSAAQLVSLESSRSRFMKEEPDLDLE